MVLLKSDCEQDWLLHRRPLIRSCPPISSFIITSTGSHWGQMGGSMVRDASIMQAGPSSTTHFDINSTIVQLSQYLDDLKM